MIPTRYSIRKTPECRKTPMRAQVHVPLAVMTAIVAPALFFPGAAPTITFDTPRRVATAVAALVARRTQGGVVDCGPRHDDAVGIAGFYALAEYH